MGTDENMYAPLVTGNGQVLGVPGPTYSGALSSRPFRSGMFDCCSDMDSCCFGYWCNPCLYGVNVRTAQEMDGNAYASCVSPCCCLYWSAFGSSFAGAFLLTGAGLALTGCNPTPGALIASKLAGNLTGTCAGLAVIGHIAGGSRKKFREKYGIHNEGSGACSTDFARHFWCHACALCQERREMKAMLLEGDQSLIDHASTMAPEQQEMNIPARK